MSPSRYASRHERAHRRAGAWSCSEQLANLGVRLIGADRPGYGLSSSHPERTLLTAADDTAALADDLGLDRFAAAGWSGGVRSRWPSLPCSATATPASPFPLTAALSMLGDHRSEADLATVSKPALAAAMAASRPRPPAATSSATGRT